MVEITDRVLIESLEKKLSNIEVKELEQSIEELQKLLSLWKQKQGRFQPDNRKKLFEEIIDLCAEIYPHIVNITCKPFIFSSPLRHGDIEIKNLRIIIDSSTFIQALKKEQDFAFETNKIRRDNIIHQFRVFLLGQYFLSKYEHIVNWLWEDLWDFLPRNFQCKEHPDKEKIILGVWALASLFHDCGRGIESFYKNLRGLKACFEEIFRIFEVDMPAINTDMQLNDLWERKKETFFKLLEYFMDRGEKSKYYKKIKSLLERAIENSNHGILSALLITYAEAGPLICRWNKKDMQLSMDISADEGTDTSNLAKVTTMVKKSQKATGEVISKVTLPFYSALAIAFHDIKEYWFLTRLTQFLILCDNLQEWNRLTKLGDQSIMIFPCEKIQLDVERKDNFCIKVQIFYREREGEKSELEREIFKRWNPKEIWRDFKKKVKAKQTEDLFKLYKDQVCAEITITYSKNGEEKTINISIP